GMITQPPSLTAATLAADRQTLATGYSDGSVSVWDTATGKELRSFKISPPGRLNMLRFAPDAKGLIIRGNDDLLLLHNAEGKEVRTFGKPFKFEMGKPQLPRFRRPESAALVPDGKTLRAIGQELDDGMARVLVKSWSLEDGKELPLVKGPALPANFLGVQFVV